MTLTVSSLLEFYRYRLRTHLVQELLAGAGIAIGVALVFAVWVANTSLMTSAGQVVHGIAGKATLELTARSPDGIDGSLVDRIRRLPGVAAAAPLLEQRALIRGPHGARAVDLVGVDRSLAQLDGSLTRNFDPSSTRLLGRAVILPPGTARQVGVPTSAAAKRAVTVELRGRSIPAPVATVLSASELGPLAEALVAMASISTLQEMAGLPHRVTRIMVAPTKGATEQVRRELLAVARDRMNVAPIDTEQRLLERASAPNNQATGLFAIIAGLVGLLLAFNAMLLTAPERRRSIASFRLLQYTRPQVAAILGFQAVVLGSVASATGLVAGYVLANTLFAGVPSYLSFAFALSPERTIPLAVAIVSFLGGVAITLLAAAPPLLDLRASRPLDRIHREHGDPGQDIPRKVRLILLASAAVLAIGMLALGILVPSTTVVVICALAAATVLLLPMALEGVLNAIDWTGDHAGLNLVGVAVDGLRARRLRSATLAAMAALAIFGTVAIEGAHHDLRKGLDQNFVEYLGPASYWVAIAGDQNSLTTESFSPAAQLQVARAASHEVVIRPYYGTLLDWGYRRVWISAREASDPALIPPSQVVRGDRRSAIERLGHPGWIAVSDAIAHEHHTKVGGSIDVPTPVGTQKMRIAATLTNLGWGPGAAIMSAAQYRADWLTGAPAALQLDVRPGVAASAARESVRGALRDYPALRVQTVSQRDAQYRELARQGLIRLNQIATMLLIAAALSLGTGAGAAIWQLRRALVAFRLNFYRRRELTAILLAETAIVLATGCAIGTAVGLLGHWLLDRWLKLTTGFPAPWSLGLAQAIETLAFVGIAALLLAVAPSYASANVTLRAAPQE